MTREEAIRNLIHAIRWNDMPKKEALDIAIESLQEPCEDCISRKAVLQINESHHGEMPNHTNHQIWKEIKALPPVTPQPKMGRWITRHIISSRNLEMIVCSNCREEFSYDAETGVPMDYRKYCPNCGCRMVESQESEE